MTTTKYLLRLITVVKTIAICFITAIGPVPARADGPLAPLPLEQEEGKDKMLEAAKGLLRLKHEHAPELASKDEEETANGTNFDDF